MIFDEPSSSVDPATERRLMHALQVLAHGRTVLLIAHRLATVTSAETILVLEHGQIAQSGTHAELISTAGTYANLWQAHGDAPPNANLRLVASA